MIATPIIQLILAALLFFLINWLGARSREVGYGYLQLSVLAKADEAPAFNFLLRVIGPVVFTVIVGTVLHAFDLHDLTKNSFLVVFYYFGLRFAFTLATDRFRLVNWSSFLLTATASCVLALVMDQFFIQKRTSLLPNLQTFTDQIWWLILAYFYVLFNRAIKPTSLTEQRKRNFVASKYSTFKARYGHVVEAVTRNELLQFLIFSIMIIEDFNRPPVYRFVERVGVRLGLAKTIGIMQVSASAPLSDEESVTLGAQKVAKDLQKAVDSFDHPYFNSPGEWDPEYLPRMFDGLIVHKVLVTYNHSGDYARDIEEVYEQLTEGFSHEVHLYSGCEIPLEANPKFASFLVGRSS